MPYRIAKDAEDLLKKITDNEFKFQIGVMIAQSAHEKAKNVKYYY
jgi:hypothetical protein